MTAKNAIAARSAVVNSNPDTAPLMPEHIQILYQEPQKPFTIVAYVSVGRSSVANDASVERKFKAVAATMGADAVIVDALPKTPVVGIVVQGKGRAIKWSSRRK